MQPGAASAAGRDGKGKSMKHSDGFTLLEALIVAGITVLLLAIAVPAVARAADSADSAVCRAGRKTLKAMTAAASVSSGIDWTNYHGTGRAWTSEEILSYLKKHGAEKIKCPCGGTITVFRINKSSVIFRCSKHGGDEDTPVTNSAVFLGNFPTRFKRQSGCFCPAADFFAFRARFRLSPAA